MAGNFVILANAAVTCTDGNITGNVGTNQAAGSVDGATTMTDSDLKGAVLSGA